MDTLVTSGLFFTSVQAAVAHSLRDAHVWNIACCIWSSQVATDTLSRIKRTAMLTHVLFDIRFR